jgi:hypothetical protein
LLIVMHWKKWVDLTRPKASGAMGFRDIRKFNLVMLGKEGWRIMANPSSLCAPVLKSRYFLNEEFMTARKRNNSSHTWCAILAKRAVLERGLIHCRDGSSTNIWNDKLIPGAIGMKPICRLEGASATLVCELLNQTRSWDDRILSENFVPMDATTIRCIALGRFDDDSRPGHERNIGYTQSDQLT